MYFHVYLIYRFTRTFTDHSSVITRCWGFELQNGKSSLKSPQTLATQDFARASFLSTHSISQISERIAPRCARFGIPALWSKEPLNNSLCPVSARCISRNLHLVKVISVQNGHYFSAFLLLFLKKGRLPLYQVAESFRPAMASAYKLAQANIAYSRFSFFFRPRYTVFL